MYFLANPFLYLFLLSKKLFSIKKRLDFWQDVESLEKYVFDSQEGKKRIEEMEKYFPLFKEFLGKRILDIGCGAGIFTFWLERKGYEVVGVDIEKNNKTCREN